jgi:hypothetical protein
MERGDMKRAVRAFLKIPLTPLFLCFTLFMLAGIYVLTFFEWAYEVGEDTKKDTQDMKRDIVKAVKKWCTTI